MSEALHARCKADWLLSHWYAAVMSSAVMPPPKQPVDCTACNRKGVMPDTDPDDECKEQKPVPEKAGPVKLGDDPATRKDGIMFGCKKRPSDAGPPFKPSGVPLRGRGR